MTRLGATGTKSITKADINRQERGKLALREYLEGQRGRAAEVSRRTHILPSILSKMATRPGYPISIESAMLIEVATEGAVKADVICPLRGSLLRQLVELRAVAASGG